MSDEATRAVARHLRGLNLGGADPDVVALEILQVLRGHGWRPTKALPLPPPAARPASPEAIHAIAAQARAAVEARAAAARAALKGDTP